MASYAWYIDGNAPTAISEYRVEHDRKYPVKVSVPSKDPWSGIREVGQASVSGSPGAFEVEFTTEEHDPRFYGVWRVDQAGTANLSEILLAIGPN